MFSRDERAEIRCLFYDELIKIHESLLRAGSYNYLCLMPGETQPIYAHEPMGKVIWHRPWL
jgi:hypothetical protein